MIHRLFACVLLLAGALCLSGCNTVGPRSIAAGRPLYNEVINRTEDEQILNMIVRYRYDETFGMLGVASVTANIKVGASAQVEAGFGPDEDYDGNLVPFAGGLAYEENPTISYVPLSGEQVVLRMLSSIPLQQAMTVNRLKGRETMLFVSRVNGLYNVISLDEEPSPEFQQLRTLITVLAGARVLQMGIGDDGFYIVMQRYANRYQEEVQEVLDLLKLTAFEADGEELLIPVLPMVAQTRGDAIHMEMRSVMDMVSLVAIDVPEEHAMAGIVEHREIHPDQREPFIRIRSSTEPPRNATVAIPFRDHWFYIDATDADSKQGFFGLRTLIGMRLKSEGTEQTAPVLTIPVG